MSERIRVRRGEWLEVGKVDGEKFICQIDGYRGKPGGKDQNRVNLIPPDSNKFGIDLTDSNYSWRKVERPANKSYTQQRGERSVCCPSSPGTSMGTWSATWQESRDRQDCQPDSGQWTIRQDE